MTFVSPIWLLALAPWISLAIWLLRGRGPLRGVSYLKLWSGPIAVPKSNQRRQLPPPMILAVLAAMLLGVIAAGRLAIGTHRQLAFTVIVDRGCMMSSLETEPRFRMRSDAFAAELLNRYPRSRIDLIPIPGDVQRNLTIDQFRDAVHVLLPTALDTSSQLKVLMEQHRSNAVVISNVAGDPLNDIAIVGLSLATEPHAQLMIRVQNHSTQTSTNLQISSGAQKKVVTVPLEPSRVSQNVFVDLDQVGETFEVELLNTDANPLNNTAWLVKESSRQQPEVRAALPPAVQRVVEVYTARRATTGTAGKVPVVASVADLGDSAAGVVVPPATVPTASQPAQTTANALTDHVDWKSLPPTAQIADAPDGWVPLVTFGTRVAVANNPAHQRQIWVGLNADAWSTSPDFVIFWTNVLGFAAGGADQWAAYPLSDWSSEWKLAGTDGGQPAIYLRSDGAKRAFNATELSDAPVTVEDWKMQLDHMKPESAVGEIGSVLLIAALGLIALFAVRY